MTRSFSMTFPEVFRNPVLDGERGSRADFDQVEIVMMLKVQCGSCQGIGVLVVYWKMTPEGDRWSIESRITRDAGLHTFTMGESHHWGFSCNWTWERIISLRPICISGDSPGRMRRMVLSISGAGLSLIISRRNASVSVRETCSRVARQARRSIC